MRGSGRVGACTVQGTHHLELPLPNQDGRPGRVRHQPPHVLPARTRHSDGRPVAVNKKTARVRLAAATCGCCLASAWCRAVACKAEGSLGLGAWGTRVGRGQASAGTYDSKDGGSTAVACACAFICFTSRAKAPMGRACDETRNGVIKGSACARDCELTKKGGWRQARSVDWRVGDAR